MRIEPETRERLSGFEVGDAVNVQYDTRRGSLSIKTGKITKITAQGVAVIGTDDLYPVMFTWASIRTIGKRRA